MNDTTLRVVFCTCPPAEAQKLARQIVESKRAACVNIVPGIQSIYMWEGAIEEDAESLLIIKTTSDRLKELETHLVSIHPYDVPEVIALPITEGSDAYTTWVRNVVGTN